MMTYIYTAFIFLYITSIRLAALLGHSKAKLWVRGRKQLYLQYQAYFRQSSQDKWIWIHASSLGEFEQGRSIIELLKQKHPDIKILLTFFSPSGYEIRKNYEYADAVLYFPPDFPWIIRNVIRTVRPVLVIFVKYDFWFHFLKECSRQGVPVIFVSSLFRPTQYFFKAYGKWFRRQLQQYVSMFFVQNKESAELLKTYGFSNITISGDTRIDRVIRIREQTDEMHSIMQRWSENRQIIVAGSTWPPDERILKEVFLACPDLSFILAPHDVSEKRLYEIEQLFGKDTLCRLSQFSDNFTGRILMIDCIGLLSKLYRYGMIAYIGNGFGRGIHNILEAVVYGKPVIFGPNYQKFPEAVYLVKQYAAFPVYNAEQCIDVVKRLIYNDEFYRKASDACYYYIEQNQGAATCVVQYIEKNFLKKFEKI